MLIMTDLFFVTYDELVLLTKAWRIHGSLSCIVVNMPIDLASNSARYVGGINLPKGNAVTVCLHNNYAHRTHGQSI